MKNNKEIIIVAKANKSVKQLIAEGNYDWRSTASAKTLPVAKKKKEETTLIAKLFSFKREIISKDIIKLMAREGYRPATFVELLILGINYPKLQKEGSIVALGTTWPVISGFSRLLSLDFEGGVRRATLSWDNVFWTPRDRFLGILIENSKEA